MSLKALILAILPVLASLPADANRLTLEVWPDNRPDHASFCTVALAQGWITVVQVRGVGMPAPYPARWRASAPEEQAMLTALEAFLARDLTSVASPYVSRLPPAPFVTVTWMTTLDDNMATGLYIQDRLPLPPPLAEVAQQLGLTKACGLSARTAE
jgi:hypothetical protein